MLLLQRHVTAFAAITATAAFIAIRSAQAGCYIVDVPAQPPDGVGTPFPTGIFVDPNDVIVVSVDPDDTWDFCPGCPAGPNGNHPPGGDCVDGSYTFNSNAVLPDTVFGCLIGSVGDPGPLWSGGPGWLLDNGVDVNPCSGMSGAEHEIAGGFGAGFVGSAFCAVSPVGGEIHLGMNDDPCCQDNGGSLRVYITVLRPHSETVVAVPAQPPGGVGTPFATGVFVESGDAVVISVDPNDTWEFCPGCPAGPNGNFPPGNDCVDGSYTFNSNAVLPDIAFGSLIGSVGDCGGALDQTWSGGPCWLLDDGLDVNFCSGLTGNEHGLPGAFDAGFVGSSFCGVVCIDGEIHLGMNDDPINNDNSGDLRVTISVYLNDCDPQAVVPTSFSVPFGDYQSGQVEDLHESDDAYVVIRQRAAVSVLLPAIRLEIEGRAGSDGPFQLITTVESATNALPSQSPQEVWLFNYGINGWELVDERIATMHDSVVCVNIDSDPGRFVESGTHAIGTRLDWFDPGDVFFAAWETRTDRVRWTTTRVTE